MGTIQRREREKRRRRQEIVDSARALFFDKGFRDTTIDDIARTAELARGTIYLYFETKEEVYATVLEEGIDLLWTTMEASQSPEADPMSNLLAGHDAFLRFHDEQPHYYNVLMLDKMQITDVLTPALRERLNAKFIRMAEFLAGILEEGMSQGLFRPLPAREAAYLQMGMAMGFTQMLDKCAGNPDAFSDRAQARQVMHDLIANSVVARR